MSTPELPINPQQAEILGTVFTPYLADKMARARLDGLRLSHYTTAASAMEIIRNRTLWMRNTGAMADWMEVHYGFANLAAYFQRENRKNFERFKEAFNDVAPDVPATAIARFDQWLANIQTQTFIACFSEHDASEDYHGRLSMWRTFASGTTGVAVIFRLPDPYSSPGLRAMMVPAAYFTEDHINTELDSVIENVTTRKDFLKVFTADFLLGYFYVMLLTLTVSQKHPGFHEEREWRLVYAPDQFPSDHLRRETKTIHGIPQIVYELPLIDSPDKGVNVDLVRLLDRVIIGPSQYANTVWDALVKELNSIGVADAHTKVFISGIPLRN